MTSQALGDNKPNFQNLERLWGNANASFHSHDFDAAMTDLNAAVTLIQQDVMARTLLKRAMTHNCQGNSQESIQDIFKAIDLSPLFADAYLFAGIVLRSVARYGEALDVYSKGIFALQVSSGRSDQWTETNQENIHRLVQAKREIEWDIDRTNSYLFKKLPLELTHDIFANLISFQDRTRCMYTCRFWQTFLLDQLPRMSHRLILGNMPKQAMTRLVSCHVSCTSKDSGNENSVAYSSGGVYGKMKKGVSISILPGTSPLSFMSALQLLSDPCLHISSLDILIEFNEKNRHVKPAYIRTLRENRSTLKRLTVCSVTDAMVTVNALDNCPKLSHLIVAANHILLECDNKKMPRYTFRGKELCSNSYEPKIEYGRDIWRQQQQGHGNVAVNYSANPIVLSETSFRRQNAGITRINQPTKPHLQLRRLELVGIEVGYFLNPVFWSRLPNLEHLEIKEPVGLHSDFNIISHCVIQYCQKLKTFRFGRGWDNSGSDDWDEKEDVKQLQEQQEHHKEQFALRELMVYSSYYETISAAGGATIIPSLISSANCEFLQVLILQAETLTASGLEQLVDLHCPNLRNFQLHQRWSPVYANVIIEQRHTAALVKNFPALKLLVLNGVKLTPTSLNELKNATQLRSLSLLPWYSSINNQTTPINSNLYQTSQEYRPQFEMQVDQMHQVQAIQRHRIDLALQQGEQRYRSAPFLINRNNTIDQEQAIRQHRLQIIQQQRAAIGTYAINNIRQEPRQPYRNILQEPPVNANNFLAGDTTVNERQGDVTQESPATRRNQQQSIVREGTLNHVRVVERTINGVTVTTTVPVTSQPMENIFKNCIHNYKALTELCIGGGTFTDADLIIMISKNCQLTSIKLIKCSSITPNGLVDAFSSSSASSLPSLQYLRQVTLVSIKLDKPAIINIARLPRLKELAIIECDSLEYNKLWKILNDEQQQYEYLPVTSSPITARTAWMKYNELRTYFIPQLYIPYDNQGFHTYILDCMPGQSSVLTRTTDNISIIKPILDFI